MRFDERAQSVQIGAVLLFAALILALAGYQAFVVPQQNEQVEFSHSQTVQNQLTDLRNALVSAPGETAPRSVSVALGTRYPARMVAVNPGPATGALRTSATTDPSVNVSVANAEANGELGDVWNGTQRNYSTGWLSYRPNYNVYGGAPATYYGSSVLFNEFSSGTVPLSGQTLVDGDRISLVALNGSMDVTRSGTAAVDVRPVSSSTTTVSVTDDGEPIRLRVPTRLSEETWHELLADEMDSDGNVSNVTVTDDMLVITLEQDENYTLQLAKAGVGAGVTDTTEAYMTDVSGNDTSVREGESELLVVEVRDEYNNPVSGVTVEADADGGGVDDPTATTGSDGRATFLYAANPDAGGSDYEVRFSYDDPTTGFAATDPADVAMTVSVQSTGGGAGGGGSPYDLTWESPTTDPDYPLDVSNEGPDLDMQTLLSDAAGDISPGTVEDVTVDYGLNDSTIGTLSDSEAVTDADGEASTTFSAEEEGTVRIYATAGGTSDVINVSVTNITGQADPGHPYEDVNQDGRFQSGTDIALTKADVEGGYTASSGNGLVVPASTGAIDAGADAVTWEADGITAAVDVTGNDVTMDAGNRPLDAGGITVESPGDVTLRGNSVSLEQARVDDYLAGSNDGRSITIEATGGDLAAADLTAATPNDLTVSGTKMDLAGATLDGYVGGDGFGDLEVSADGTITATDATVDTNGALTVSGDAVDVSGTTLDNYQSGDGNGAQLTVEATNGDVTAVGTTAAATGDLTVSGTDVDVSDATLNNYQGDDGFGRLDVTGSGTVTATNAELDSESAITVSGGTVDVSQSSLDNYQNGNGAGQPITVTASTGELTGTAVDVDTAATIEFEGISLDLTDGDLDNYQNGNGFADVVLRATAGDTVLEGVVLTTDNDGSQNLRVYGTDTSGDDLFVEGGEFYEGNTNGNNGDLYNMNGVDVAGSPARGSVVTP